MIESNESRTRDIPVWLTAIVLLLCIGGGGYLIWWYLGDRPHAVVAAPDADKTVVQNKWKGALAGGQRAPRDQAFTNADGIQSRNSRSFRVKTGNTIMMVNYGATSKFSVALSYLPFRTSEQEEMSMMARSVLLDPTWREHLKVTEAQLDILRKLPPLVSMKVETGDEAALSDLWKTYNDLPAAKTAEKAAAEKALLAKLDEIGKKNFGPTKDYEAARVATIRTALTPEQVKLFVSASSNKVPTPTKKTLTTAPATTRPTTRPTSLPTAAIKADTVLNK